MAQRAGSLYVDLTLNFAKFTQGLDKSRTASTTFGVAVGTVMANVALRVAEMGKQAALSLPRLVEHSIDVADQMGKMAQKAQVSVESFSALAHAATLSDISVETLTVSLGRFGRNIAEAEGGNKKLSAAFRDVGVSANDLKTLGVDQVFAKVAGGFAAIPDGAKKAQVGFELFERAWQDLVPLLNQGTTGITAAIEEAKKLGLVIGGDTAKQAEKFNDNIKSLHGAVSGLGLAIGKDVLPKLVDLSTQIIEFVKESDLVQRVADSFTFLFQEIATGGVLAVGVMRQLILGTAGLLQTLEHLGKAATSNPVTAFHELQKAMATVDEAGVEMKLHFKESVSELQKIWADGVANLSKGGKTGGGNELADSLGASLDSAIAGLKNRHIEPIHIPIDLSDFQKDLTQTGFFQALSLIERSTAEQRIISLTKSIEEFQQNLLLAGKPFLDLNEVAKMNEVTAKSLGHEWEDALLKAQGAGERANSVMQDLTHTLAQGFEDAIIGGQGLRGILQGIIQDVERLILRMTITGPSGVLAGIIGSIGNTIAGAFGGGAAGSGGRVLAGGGTILGGAEVPHFATGGIVTKPTFAMIGERGPEAIVPLSKMRGSGGGGTVNVTYQIDARGADAGAEQRIRQGLRATHARAVSDALKIGNELKLRTA